MFFYPFIAFICLLALAQIGLAIISDFALRQKLPEGTITKT
jgi:hypothetical protein